MVISESAVRWRRASSHHWRNSASLGAASRLSSCRSSSSIVAFVLWRVIGYPIFEALVGFDDALHQRMAHDVLGLEVGEADARHVFKHFDHMVQPGLGAFRQVDLGDVTGDDCSGA